MCDGSGMAVTKATLTTFERLEMTNRLGGLFIEWNQPFLFCFTSRNAQSRSAIRISVQTINLEATNFSSARSAPTGNQQCCPLKRTRSFPNRSHQTRELFVRNEAWHSLRLFG